MPPDASGEARRPLDELSALRIAQELFTTEWYHRACDMLQFDPETCRSLKSVAEETAREREGVLRVMQEWAEGGGEGTERESRAALSVSRVDFLRTVIEAKQAAGETLEGAAALAPPQLRTRLRDLATIDFRHAELLRDILRRELRKIGP